MCVCMYVGHMSAAQLAKFVHFFFCAGHLSAAEPAKFVRDVG
jgi:hypothetical protein